MVGEKWGSMEDGSSVLETALEDVDFLGFGRRAEAY